MSLNKITAANVESFKVNTSWYRAILGVDAVLLPQMLVGLTSLPHLSFLLLIK